jgi:hypothetical protein
MQIKLETMTLTEGAYAGTPVYDLVLTQGTNTIRLGLIADDAAQAIQELATWLDDNSMDLVEIAADCPAAQKGVEEPPLQGTVRVRQSGGAYVAQVRVGDTCLYTASCTMGADQAAQSLAAKVQAARCATRVTLSDRLIGLARVRGRPDEDQYLLSIYEA